MGPAQREHTIGGKLLGGFVWLRRTPRRAELFGVGSDMVALDPDVMDVTVALSP